MPSGRHRAGDRADGFVLCAFGYREVWDRQFAMDNHLSWLGRGGDRER